MSIISRDSKVVLKGSTTRLELTVRDENDDLADPIALTFSVSNLDDTVLYEDDYFDPPDPPNVTRIERVSEGIFYFPLGDQTLFPLEVGGDDNLETATAQTLIAKWQVQIASGESQDVLQIVHVVTAQTLKRLHDLRLRIDKLGKEVDTDPDDPVYLGYTDSMLIAFLEGGLGIINSFQPTVVWSAVDDFPAEHERILLEAAFFDALISQEVFAVDTDLSYCLAMGSLVATADGNPTRIEHLKVGDYVLDSHGKPQRVLAAWCEGTPKETVHLTTWGGKKIEATPHHRFPVWVWPRTCHCGCEKSVKPGQMFAHGHHARMKGKYEKVLVQGTEKRADTQRFIPKGYEPRQIITAEEIREDDFLMIPRTFEPIETDVSASEARILGYWAAEGHASKAPCGDWTNLGFTFHEKEEDTWVKDIQAAAEDMGFETSVTASKTCKAVQLRTKNDYKRSTAVLRLATLAQQHIGEFSTEKQLSEELMRWPLHLKREFIKGLIRGDGHQDWFNGKKDGYDGWTFRVHYATSSKSLSYQVELILAQLGYPCSRSVNKAAKVLDKRNGKVLNKGESYVLHVVGEHADTLAQLVWEGQSRHDERPRSKVRSYCMIDDEYIYVPVKKVERRAGNTPVFNLTVENDHTYLVNNIATQNSDQGNVFSIDKQPKLASIINASFQRLTAMVPPMKRQYVTTGSIHVQLGPNFRFQQMLAAAPSGSYFRNFFIA